MDFKIRTGTAVQFQEGRANEQSYRYHDIEGHVYRSPWPPSTMGLCTFLQLATDARGGSCAGNIASMGPLDLVPRLLKLSYRFLSLIWKLLTVKNLDVSIESHII